MRADLEQQVDSTGLQQSIRFRGYLQQDLLAQELRESQVLVLPSLLECGGAVVLEAMASGLPVIATAWGGPMDYIDEDSGILIAPHSREQMVADIAQAICDLHGDPERREALAVGALRRAQHFDWERNIDRMLDTYRRASVAI